ncbi:hypothetical protein P4H39_19010 [Paenibacillus lautus]|uniref:hypothetical protein n=1 Tax=Paenibacillus lautus TaxID=1401 RepID=UPI002DC0463F|nr:hypothetical protein [Paenibacillus lautus]MEC0204698.1 hypothetical protein [Paenibacillus lautus]
MRASHGIPDILQYNQAWASIKIANTSSVAHAKNKDDAMFHTERTGSNLRFNSDILDFVMHDNLPVPNEDDFMISARYR